jgi:branched-chain amino acid transport system permease protein
MLYREAGQFKSTYAADMAISPLRQDRVALWLVVVFL